MIETRDLVKTYGERTAVRQLTFKVGRGEIVGLLGKNGAGKSTTMRMLSGYVAPDSGVAMIDGHDVTVDPLGARRALGYLPEDSPLYADMAVVEYLGFIARVRRVTEPLARTRVVVEQCALGDVLRRPIRELSRGYRQRVGLAQALLHDPKVLILDEATSGLDPSQVEDVRACIREVGREKTVFLSTHILREVRAVCSRVMILRQGELVADASVDDVGGYLFTVACDKARDVATLVRALPGVRRCLARSSDPPQLSFRVESEGDPRPELFRLAVRQGWTLLELGSDVASLESAFFQATGEAAS